MELKPETEQLVREEIKRGHFHAVDELIAQSVHAWRDKYQLEPPTAQKWKKKFDQFLLDSPPPVETCD